MRRPCRGHPSGIDRRRIANIYVERKHPVLDVKVSQDLHHLVENELPPVEPHPHVLEIDGVPAPDGYFQPVCVVDVAEHDHGARVPVLFLVVKVAEI